MRMPFPSFLSVFFSCVAACCAAPDTIAETNAFPKPSEFGVVPKPPQFIIEWAEETITVTAKPRSGPPANRDSLSATNFINRDYFTGCGIPPHIRSVPVPLDTNQVYTFTILQKTIVRKERLHKIGITELRKVELGGETIYDIEVCAAHKTKMTWTEARVAYGLMAGTHEPRDAAGRPSFPNHREYKLGGCMVGPGSPKTEKILVCSECKKGFERWKEEEAKSRDAARAAYRKQMFDQNGTPRSADPRVPMR